MNTQSLVWRDSSRCDYCGDWHIGLHVLCRHMGVKHTPGMTIVGFKWRVNITWPWTEIRGDWHPTNSDLFFIVFLFIYSNRLYFNFFLELFIICISVAVAEPEPCFLCPNREEAASGSWKQRLLAVWTQWTPVRNCPPTLSVLWRVLHWNTVNFDSKLNRHIK